MRPPALPQDEFRRWWAGREEGIAEQVADLVAIDTSTPHEDRAFPLLEAWLGEAGFAVRREPVHARIADHPAFTPHPASEGGEGRCNLRGSLGEPDEGGGVLFNCHVDVVPGSTLHGNSFHPSIRDGAVYGRGSADTKGNLVMLLEALRYLRSRGEGPSRPVLVDLVVEEEIGGNGTLSTILHGVPADEVVVLEPTGLQLFRGHRGCLTFGVEIAGRPVHMGSDRSGASAIDAAIELIAELRDMEGALLAEAREDESFSAWPRPLQVNVGRVAGGEWPGSVPARCTVEGNMGFLPSYSVADAQNQLVGRIEGLRGRWSAAGHAVRFPGLRTEGYLTPGEAPLVERMLAAARLAGVRQQAPPGWLVSCDARLYARLLGLPTVIFGAGSLEVAHGDNEHVRLDELRDGAFALAVFLRGGTEGAAAPEGAT